MTMGCGSSKKLQPVSSSERVVTTKFFPMKTQSRETKHRKTSTRGKSSEKKTRVAKFRFDYVVTDKYEIKAQIGRGSFSRVVRAEHKETRQPYAIKMVELKDVHGGEDVFRSEIEILRTVKHRYIVSLHDVLTSKDRVYLVMELATGGELFDRIVSKGYFTERDAARVIYMVLDGVRYLHSHGITHRDLKLENLLYYHPGNDSRIMITDFGLSHLKRSAEDNMMETDCGSPEYQAPEILQRKPYTNAVDMWAVGVITFILLSGRMPFFHENRPKLESAISAAKYSYAGEPWPDVSNVAKDFVDNLIVVDPERRCTAEEALHHVWIFSMAASSSLKNLHESISQNWFQQSTSRINSAQSDTRSHNSNKSSRTWKSSGKSSKHYQSQKLDSGRLLQGQSKVKTKKAEAHQSTATEGVEIKQIENTKHSKQRPKVTVREVFEKVHANLRESKTSSANGRMNYPNCTNNLGSSLDNLYAAGFSGTFDDTDPYPLHTTGKNKHKYRSLSSELENKRSAIVPVGQTAKYSAATVALQDNFLLLDTPHSTTEDMNMNGIQECSCKKTFGECSYISEPQSMTISRGNKVSSV